MIMKIKFRIRKHSTVCESRILYQQFISRAEHVIRQDHDDLSRRVLLSEPGGKRPRGGPRLRWKDGVEQDVARLGCRNWKVVALHRQGWRKLLKEAEAHPGL